MRMINESKRLDNLKSYDILDSDSDPSFDHLTKLAAQLCHTEFAMICFVDHDRVWAKSIHGYSGSREQPKDQTFCSEVIKRQDLLVVENTLEDKIFNQFRIVVNEPKIRFFAGYPLKSKEGFYIGVLCVLDKKSKKFTDDEAAGLKSLAFQTEELLELRRLNQELREAKQFIEEQQDLLLNKARLQTIGELASGVCHQINNPLAIIVGRAMILRTIIQSKLPDDQVLQKELDLIDQTANRVSGILKALRIYAKDMGTERKNFSLNELIEDAIVLIRGKLNSEQVILNYEKSDDATVYINKNQISQVLMDLLNNSIESMEDLEAKKIDLRVSHSQNEVIITVSDIGKGIKPEDENRIFDPFFTTKLRHFGVGLSNAKNFMLDNKGEILLKKGKNPTTFEVRLPKL